MKNLGGGIAEHQTVEAVSKSQPLKHNGERALTPAAHCQIRPAITVPYTTCDLNTLTSRQHFYNIFGHIPVGRLPGTIKGPFKAIRYYLGG